MAGTEQLQGLSARTARRAAMPRRAGRAVPRLQGLPARAARRALQGGKTSRSGVEDESDGW